jgi:hypothetical protein
VTGQHLWDEIRQAAARAGMSMQRFSAPLFNEPNWKLEQLRIAKRPKPSTIARVRALIAGEPIPPPSGNQYCAARRPLGLTRTAAEQAGFPPSGRSVAENRNLAQALERKARVDHARDLSELARATRRPGQCLADRLRELRMEMAA